MKFIFNNKEYPSVDGVKKAYKGQGPVPPGPDYTEPFYVENINSDIETLSIRKSSSRAPTLTIEYSTDRVNWNTLGTTDITALTYILNPGDKVYLRCDTTQGWGYSGTSNYGNRISGVSKVGGNIMSLLYGSSFTGNEKTFRNTTYQAFRSLFESNSTLEDAQHLLLPATTLVKGCYYNLFYNCLGLTSVPELPATTLAQYCYYSMFRGCSLITQAPTLPATTLENYCYQSMFYGCTGLTAAPTLPATTMTTSCYSGMFRGCSSLRQAPTLPATTLAQSCYQYMFDSCVSLTTAPELPATTLATSCYYQMFYGCTGLTATPTLPATTLVSQCYRQMFYGCTNLNYIKCLATDISASLCTNGWVNGVASTGTFMKESGVAWSTGIDGIPEGWVSEDIGINLSSNINSVSIKAFGFDTGTAYYTIDGGSHIPLNEGVTNIIITEAMDGQTLYVYGEFDGVSEERSMELKWIDVTVPFWVKNEYTKSARLRVEYADNVLASLDQITWMDPTSYYVWVPSGEKVYIKCVIRSGTRIWLADSMSTGTTRDMSVGGNYMSLFYGDDFTGYETTFPYEATPNSDGYLFRDCLSAKEMILPATTLFTSCYSNMFKGNSRMVDAPTLPATTLAQSCYQQMFSNCTSLTTAPELPATTLAQSCYSGMFYGCTSLTKAPTLPATTLASSCYQQMFSNCTSLTKAPTLPATTLAVGCYYGMFKNCTLLTTAPELPATTLAQSCYQYMFEGCTSLTTAPELPATTLANWCYSYMFNGCTNLNYIKCLATNISATQCTNYWVNGVAETGTFYKRTSTNFPVGNSGIPGGWAVINV